MFDANITYFSISGRTTINGVPGFIVKLAYQLDFGEVDWEKLTPLSDVCNFREDVSFFAWWKDVVGGNIRTIGLNQKTVFPGRLIGIRRSNRLVLQYFLGADILQRPHGVPNNVTPEVFCRVSLHPVFATSRVPISTNNNDIVSTERGSHASFQAGMDATAFDF